MNSKYLSLNNQDLIKGALMAGIGAAVPLIADVLQSGELPTVLQLKTAAIIGLSTAVSYFIKNLFSNSDGKVLAKEPINPDQIHM